MAYKSILFEKEEGVATITLNRPEKLNAIHPVLVEEVVGVFERCLNDDEIRAIVLTGAGRAFSSGDDMTGMGAVWAERPPVPHRLGWDERLHAFFPICRAVKDIPKPVVAVIPGIAYGAGFEICLWCDFRIASERAQFAAAYIKRGIFSGSILLPWIVGFNRARDMILTGEPIDAEEALRIGIVNMVVPHEELQATAMKFGKKLAKGPTKTIGYSKTFLWQTILMNEMTLMDLATHWLRLSMETEDIKEGVKAFFEKREAVFVGR